MKRFSPKYKTFSEWRKLRERKSKYALLIIKKHKLFPSLKLSELRKIEIKGNDFSYKPLNKLTDAQITLRERAIQVLYNLRYGKSVAESIKNIEISEVNLKKHLGKAIYKKQGVWIARKHDFIQRPMLFYENGKITSVVVRGSRDATKVSKYMHAVYRAVEHNDLIELNKFKRHSITDADGKKRKFETRLEKLMEFSEQKEEPEFNEGVYKWH